MVVAFLLLVTIVVSGVLAVAGRDLKMAVPESGVMGPTGFALTNLFLASLIPISMLSLRIVYGINPGYLSSVAGGLRWQWLLRCTAISAPVFIVYLGLDLLFDPPEDPRPGQWALLLLLVLLGTPLQAAGEKYLVRGLIQQNVGAWFRSPRVAMLVATVVSTVVFSAAHGCFDLWIFPDLSIVAVACCILVWRTGGLEAAIALHAVNSMAALGASALTGGWGEGIVQETSKGDPLDP
jgi:uncharacterized protein